MAAAPQLKDFTDELSCSICLEHFNEPVSIDCGHNFCRPCIAMCWQQSEAFICPQCRHICQRRNVRLNHELRNVVEKLKRLSLPITKLPGESVCEKHDEKLKLFCEEDEKIICVICRESKEHKSHSVSPVEEAAEEYKKKLKDCLCPLKKELEDLTHSKLMEEEKHRTVMVQMETENQEIVNEMERMRQLLKEKEKALHQNRDKNKMVTREKRADLSHQMDALKTLIAETEEKFKEPVREFLMGIRGTLNRCNNVNFNYPKKENERKKKRPKNKKKQTWEEIVKYKVVVTLDPDTASANLILSSDRKHVKDTEVKQYRPEHPRRFTMHNSVLGREGVTSGKRYWEVQLLKEGNELYVGVADEFVREEDGVIFTPRGGIWCVAWCKDHYQAFADPEITLSLLEKPKKLGLFLDYERGELSVYNADTKENIYTFNHGSFEDKMFPFFYMWGGAELRLV